MQNNLIIKPNKSITVADFLKHLLTVEGKVEHTHPKIIDSLNLLKNISPFALSKPATDANLSGFLLAVNKKNKQIADYYKNLVRKYTQTNIAKPNIQSNIYEIINSLLEEANIAINPQNYVDKYFCDAGYAFAVGVNCEQFYKYMPDDSIQEVMQKTMRMRVAFLMTLMQMRTDKFGILKHIYLSGRYGRELSLCALYHSLAILDFTQNYDEFSEQYQKIAVAMRKEIKSGSLSLPERRIFRLISPVNKLVLKKELKKFLSKDQDYTQNALLQIISVYKNNYEKVQDKIFPVIAVRNPVTGKMIKATLTLYGLESQNMKEVSVPVLSIISDNNLEEKIRKEIALRLANTPDKSLEDIVKEVLMERNLDSENIFEIVLQKVRESVYETENWNRRLLFFQKNFDKEKTVFGNLIMSALVFVPLSAQVKERIETVGNISGRTLTLTALGFVAGGLPAAVVLGATSIGMGKVTQKISAPVSYATGMLMGARSFSKHEIVSLANHSEDAYGNIFGLMFSNNSSSLSSWNNLLTTSDIRGQNFRIINDLTVKTVKKISMFINFIKTVGQNTANKLGFSNNLSQINRRSRENLIFLQNITSSGYESNKFLQSLKILQVLSSHASVFGVSTAVFANKMLKNLIPNDKTKLNLGFLGIFAFLLPVISPNYNAKYSGGVAGGGNSVLSWFGRTLQKSALAVGQSLGLWARRNGGGLVRTTLTATGQFTARLSSGALGIASGNGLNKATVFLVISSILFGGIAMFFVFQSSSTSFTIAEANRPPGRGGSDLIGIEGSNSNTDIRINGKCPIQPPAGQSIFCSQPGNGSFTHHGMRTKAIDLSYSGINQVYAVGDGELQVVGTSCQNGLGGNVVALYDTVNKINYYYYHMSADTDTGGINNRRKVSAGELIGRIVTGNIPNCLDGPHLHIETIVPTDQQASINNRVYPTVLEGKRLNSLTLSTTAWGCSIATQPNAPISTITNQQNLCYYSQSPPNQYCDPTKSICDLVTYEDIQDSTYNTK